MAGRPWVMRMRWLDLLFAHWPIEPAALAAIIPPPLELDLFEGQAWLGVVPFRMEDVAPRGVPAIPRFSAFPEINVRTYVRHRGVPGVWFLSLDAASRPTVVGAHRFFHLPYFRAAMSSERDEDAVEYRSRREDDRAPAAEFVARYRPTGPAALAEPGSLEAWLTDRWRLFSVDRSGAVYGTSVRHRRWPLQPAAAHIRVNTMARAHGLELPPVEPNLLFSRRVNVRGWWPRRE